MQPRYDIQIHSQASRWSSYLAALAFALGVVGGAVAIAALMA